jgi:hypothetical protein
MEAFWSGFEKRATLLQSGAKLVRGMVPKAQAAYQKAKPVMQQAAVKTRDFAGKAKAEAMKTPQRALATGLAAGAAGTYAMTRPQETPMQYGSMAAYY